MWSPTRYKTTVFPIKRKLNILAFLTWHNMNTTFNNSRKKTYLAKMRMQDRIWCTIVLMQYMPFTVIPWSVNDVSCTRHENCFMWRYILCHLLYSFRHSKLFDAPLEYTFATSVWDLYYHHNKNKAFLLLWSEALQFYTF